MTEEYKHGKYDGINEVIDKLCDSDYCDFCEHRTFCEEDEQDCKKAMYAMLMDMLKQTGWKGEKE